MYTGMRISELLGLKWEDIDLKKNIINVRRQYFRGEWCPPKGNKERIIPIHEKIKEVVTIASASQSLTGPVFTTSSGLPLDYHNVVTSLNRFYKRNRLECKKFHAYRATFITNLCRNGVPIQTSSKLAGHDNISVTNKYYISKLMNWRMQLIKFNSFSKNIVYRERSIQISRINLIQLLL